MGKRDKWTTGPWTTDETAVRELFFDFGSFGVRKGGSVIRSRPRLRFFSFLPRWSPGRAPGFSTILRSYGSSVSLWCRCRVADRAKWGGNSGTDYPWSTSQETRLSRSSRPLKILRERRFFGCQKRDGTERAPHSINPGVGDRGRTSALGICSSRSL